MATFNTTFKQQIGTTNEWIDVLIEYGQDFTNDGLNDIKVTLTLDPASNSGTEDMIGVAFDIQNDAVQGLQIVNIQKLSPNNGLSTYTPTAVIGANQVSDDPKFLDPGFNTTGGGTLLSEEPYDIGVKFSDQGSGEGIVQSASFVIKSNQSLDAATLLSNTNWWVRLQSTDGGEGSAKTGGFIGNLDSPGTPQISINKVTGNGTINGDGLTILAGSPVTWTYNVTNTGTNAALSGVTVRDDNGTSGTGDDFTATYVSGDSNGDGMLQTGETWVYTATGTAGANDYSNVGTATGVYNNTTVTATDSSSYLSANPSLTINKVTNGSDGLNILEGSAITWTYTVTNTGNVGISSISLTDDKEGGITNLVSGDSNGNSIFDAGEIWTYTKAGIAQVGDYSNIGTVKGSYTDSLGNTKNLEATDPSSYFGAKPSLKIDKVTGNGTTNSDGLNILAGSAITWTYTVTNTGNVGVSSISLTDDKEGGITNLVSGDTNNNSTLDINEIWTYTKAGIAQVGDYSNIGTVKGSYTDSLGNTKNLEATDPSSYFGANPSLTLNKVTNGSDGSTIIAGSAITWTYTVTNTGNVGISSINLTDDKEGAVTNFVGGDSSSNGIFDAGEAWTYTKAGIAQVGNYSNIGTVKASYIDGLGNTKSLTATDPSSYFGADPKLKIDKVTVYGNNKGDGLNVVAGSSIGWEYTVTNAGNVGISNVTVRDDSGTSSNTGDDFTATYKNGDANSNSILDIGETWTYSASGKAIQGSYTNIGTANGSFNGTSVSAKDSSNYTGFSGPGVRTPGFWSNWTQIWDGDTSNDSTFAGREFFPGRDILYNVTDPVSGSSSVKGILIGDYNKNGITDAGENTIFYSLQEARSVVNASQKTQQDVRYTLDRSLVASWLNFIAGNPADTVNIDNGVKWLQVLTPDENGDKKGDGYVKGLGSSTLDARSPEIVASSSFWNSGILSINNTLPSAYIGNTSVSTPIPSGSSINGLLDQYNNTGRGIAAAPAV